MSPQDRSRLRLTLDGFDEAGLVALANKGLVRRAEKDLQAGGLSFEETESALLVRGPGWTVTMPPDGPARARDDTRASGITRQILTATIFLRDNWRPDSRDARSVDFSPRGNEQRKLAWTKVHATDAHHDADVGAVLEEALLAVTMDNLRKWAGKTVLAEALPLLDPPPVIEVERHAGLFIRLTQFEVEARLLPSAAHRPPSRRTPARLLDEVLSTASKASHKRWVVVAVLAFQQSRGKAVNREGVEPLEEPRGAPRSREQVLSAARELLEGMILTGLAHPSERMTQRLLTLSVSTGAVNLPRLARLLRTLADDVSLILSRDAQADSRRLFARMAYAHALAAALSRSAQAPPAALVGQHRSEYHPAGDLELAGVGAWPWHSAAGFEGLTLLFWDLGERRFRTWAVSRPSAATGHFSMAAAYQSEMLWGAGSLERMSRSRFTLTQARSNPLGRLSGSKKTMASQLLPTVPTEIDLGPKSFTDWELLDGYARSTLPAGLSEPNPLDRIVALQPAVWGERAFDELQQRFLWRIQDAEGRGILLTLPWLGVNEGAVEFLESVKPDRDRLTHVLVRIAPGATIGFEPLSVLSAGTPHGHQVLNPAFDAALLTTRSASLLERLRKKFGRDRIASVMTADDDDSPESLAASVRLPGAMEAWFSRLEAAILQLAESGTRRFPDSTQSQISQLRDLCDRSGLQILAKSLEDLSSPQALLWCGYLCQLHRQAAIRAGSPRLEVEAEGDD